MKTANKQASNLRNGVVSAILAAGFLIAPTPSTIDLGVSVAHSEARQCRGLRAELASLNTRSGNKKQFRKYDRAVKKQRAQLARAEQQAKRARCKATIFSFGKSAQCQRFDNIKRKMKRNIAALERKRNSYAGAKGNSASRSRIIKSKMRGLKCGVKVQKASVKPGILRTFGNTKQTSPNYSVNVKGGNLRTLCVRPTDGYYFPISFSADRRQLQQDAQSCATRCPGAALYVHHNTSEEPEDMRSLDGKLYRNLPTAFLYRTKGIQKDESCKYTGGRILSYKLLNKANGKPTNVKTIKGIVKKVAEYAPIPTQRPDPSLNREQMIDERGQLTLARMAEMVSSGSIGDSLVANPSNRIRVIGPVFLPAQAAVEDLQVPGRVVDQ